GEPRRCTFIEGRQCSFEADQLSMDFCKVCIDAWRSSGGARVAQPVDRSREKLTQIDALFQRGELEPEDYVRLRRSLMGEAPAESAAAKPVRKGFHLLLVEKSMFSKKVRTFPAGWGLPPAITGKLVESLYSMCDSADRATDVKLEVGELRMACLARDGGKLALIVTEDDLSVYPDLITSVGVELEKSEEWEELLRVAASGQSG
ncbi:TPA: hypothetical protein HA344_06770, partial [Candidatus Bathyarchaeota archaeon]|nr:hypothetical protein [Candidatus Bathyarchaeota archaeon]